MTSETPLTPVPDLGPDIAFTQAQASELYGRDYRKALASDDGFQRLDAVERLAGARAALSVQEVAVMDMAQAEATCWPRSFD